MADGTAGSPGLFRLGLRCITAIVGVVAAAWTLAACGSSPKPSAAEQTFLVGLHKPSQFAARPWPDDRTLIAQGHQVCADITGPDSTPQQAIHHQSTTEAAYLQQHTTGFADYPREQIEHLIGVAHLVLCPSATLQATEFQ